MHKSGKSETEYVVEKDYHILRFGSSSDFTSLRGIILETLKVKATYTY